MCKHATFVRVLGLNVGNMKFVAINVTKAIRRRNRRDWGVSNNKMAQFKNKHV